MAEYFSHDYDAREDEKIQHLLYKLKWEGYGLYWAIVEMLYKNDGYLTIEYERIAHALQTQSDIIKCIIEDFNLFRCTANAFYSPSALHRLKLRKGKSVVARKAAKIRWDKEKQKNADALQVQSDSNAKKKSKGKERKEKEINSLHAQMRAEFEQHFFNEKGIEYYWEGKDGNALKSIITKLRKATNDQGEISDDNKILETWQVILKNIHDKWIKENLSVPLINSKYNQIVATIVNRGQGSELQEYKEKITKQMTNEFE